MIPFLVQSVFAIVYGFIFALFFAGRLFIPRGTALAFILAMSLFGSGWAVVREFRLESLDMHIIRVLVWNVGCVAFLAGFKVRNWIGSFVARRLPEIAQACPFYNIL